MGNADITGDAVADRLLRLIVAKAASSPCEVRRSLLAGGQSLYVSWRELAGALDLDEAAVLAAVEHLHTSGYLILDGSGNAGAHVWLQTRLQRDVA